MKMGAKRRTNVGKVVNAHVEWNIKSNRMRVIYIEHLEY